MKNIVQLLFFDAPVGPNQFRYKIAYNINANGDFNSVSGTYNLTGVGDHQTYSNIAVADINGNSRPDVFFVGNDDPTGRDQLRYRVAFDLNINGSFSFQSNVSNILGLGNYSEGASASFADIDNNGTLDLLLSTNDALIGANQFRYIFGLNINQQGITQNRR